MKLVRKKWYQFLQFQDYRLGVWSCKAMQLRGYAERPVHPKHLFDEQRSSFLHEFFTDGIAFLDLGSGVGSDCLIAGEKGAALSVGLENDWESIITAKKRSQNKHSKTNFFHFDLEQGVLPFFDDSFDLVNFSNVLEHLYNRNSILKEIRRVKKADGLAVISIPNSETSWKIKLRSVGLDSRDDPDHKIEYSKESLKAELDASGLELSSELLPIIPSLPYNGLIAMSAALSPKLYKNLQKKKRAFVEANPEESIGWVFTVK